MPKKFTSGRALACSVRNVPLPMPISISTGLALPKSCAQSMGLGSVSTSRPTGSGMSSCLVCIRAGLYAAMEVDDDGDAAEDDDGRDDEGDGVCPGGVLINREGRRAG